MKNIETKTIPVNGTTKAIEIFDSVKIGDKIYWETHGGKDKYNGVVISKDPKFFFAVTREYVEETPAGPLMGGVGNFKASWGNSIREKGFELTEEGTIWYKGDYGNVYFEKQFRDTDREYHKYDAILKENGI